MKDSYLVRLRRLDCCALSDALDKLELPGAVTDLHQFSGSRRIAGRAITVKLDAIEASQDRPPQGPPRHLGCTAIEAGDSDNVIIVEQRTGRDAGSWGGLLALGATVRGIGGVVADGPVRDIDEAREMGFPVFARTLTSRTARGRVVEVGTNVPIRVGAVQVEAGDYVAADNSAVILISARHIEDVLDTAEMIVRKEAAMAKAILAGQAIGDVMGGNYEHMLENDR
ncbi:RraA family protein [Halomonas cerina]|uniref:Putative 4-hydroxy-4-methyl-2-oxoglutarate aldolase n=1 Tax=Halomonas cerina TaxID=447424 RepID=A0A839VCT3_9GAMM|nr:RraA family protein [Halomonas cerina]MBB3191938.1 regulator of RNase E activity RraA [Halomonas cerina]